MGLKKRCSPAPRNRIKETFSITASVLLFLFGGEPARAHIPGPPVLRGNVGDVLTYTITSDVLLEFESTLYFLGSGYNAASVTISPAVPFNTTVAGTWFIQCLAPGTQTVTFAWSYAPNSAGASYPVTVIVRPAGTEKKSSSNHPHSASDNDPVNLHTGELTLEEAPDLRLGGPLPLRFMRYHASGLVRDTLVQSALGPNWSHNFDWRVLRVTDRADVITWQGRRIRFDRVGGAWQLADQPAITPFQLVDSGANLILGDPRDQRLYTFDTNGLLIAIADGRGNTHTLAYNGTLLRQVSDGLGRALTFTNTGFAELATVSDGQRNVSFGYLPTASRSYLASVTNALGNVTTYGYDLGSSFAALLTAKTRPLGNVPFAQTYDASGRVLTQTDGGVHVTTFAYNGNVTSFTNPLGNIRSYTHSVDGALVNYTDEAGQALSLSQNASGQRSVVTDRLGDTTGIAYHAPSGKPAVITNADGTLTTYLYTNHTAAGMTFYEPAQITYADGTTERFTYDGSGNVLTRTDRAGQVWTFTYNARGQVLTAQNPTGGTTTSPRAATRTPARRPTPTTRSAAARTPSTRTAPRFAWLGMRTTGSPRPRTSAATRPRSLTTTTTIFAP